MDIMRTFYDHLAISFGTTTDSIPNRQSNCFKMHKDPPKADTPRTIFLPCNGKGSYSAAGSFSLSTEKRRLISGVFFR